jgi:hypothetical protein
MGKSVRLGDMEPMFERMEVASALKILDINLPKSELKI